MTGGDLFMIVFCIIWFGAMLYMMVFKTKDFIALNEDWREGQRKAHERRMSTLGFLARIFIGKR